MLTIDFSFIYPLVENLRSLFTKKRLLSIAS
jgi:hypothetical protein